MGKYKFETAENALAAHNEILLSGANGVSEQTDIYITTKTSGLTRDLVVDIEKTIKKHGGKAVFVMS